jgi:hypothetical protein
MIYTLEDFLVRLHTGQWFRLEGERVYENLVILSADPKPTEQECIDGVALLQSDWDALEYARLRQADYPSLQDCLHAILDDDLEALQVKRQEVKNRYPKP